jgi:hypothetical protein
VNKKTNFQITIGRTSLNEAEQHIVQFNLCIE